MTLQETVEILRICKAEWPQSFTGMTKADGEARLNLWAQMFADDDAGLVGAAVKAIIVAGNREFAPNVGQIKEQMRKLTSAEDTSEAEAWALIRKAISNSGYEAVAEFEKLPPTLQRIVGSPSQLRDWSMIDSETVNSVVMSNVQRAYRSIQKREQEIEKLPSDVKELIATMSRKMLPE